MFIADRRVLDRRDEGSEEAWVGVDLPGYGVRGRDAWSVWEHGC